MVGGAVAQRLRRCMAGSSSGGPHSAAMNAFARKVSAKCAKLKPCESGNGRNRQPGRPRQADQNLFSVFGLSHSATRRGDHRRRSTCPTVLDAPLPSVRVADALDVWLPQTSHQDLRPPTASDLVIIARGQVTVMHVAHGRLPTTARGAPFELQTRNVDPPA